MDKGDWGDGPWQDEPDFEEWIDNATGLRCVAARHPAGGHWCGYVGLPNSHDHFGKGYDDIPANVHGDLTWTEGYLPTGDEDDPANLWWIGFDCAHMNDYQPSTAALLKGYTTGGETLFGHTTYRTLPYVMSELTELCRQLGG